MASNLAPVSDTLVPLPETHRSGLIAVATFGFLSFIATSTLFLYLTYKLVRWHVDKSSRRSNEDHHATTTDLSLGLSQAHFGKFQSTTSQNPTGEPQSRDGNLNQFLLLVYNLLFAEMHQSLAFLLNSSWVTSDGIFVGTSACWAQGWFISTGDLAASCFISAIAVHTFLIVIKGYRPPQWALYLTIACLWIFVYALGIIGILITQNGQAAGGLYVRAAAWCWMNVRYENLRLWLHYFWIFLSLFLTSGLYILIFFSLRRRGTPHLPSHSRAPSSSTARADASEIGGSRPGFLVYPLIYVLCTAPLALGRIATMSGRDVSVAYFCFAGSMIASNGWLDVLLFSWTRSTIIFTTSPDLGDAGLDTFTFIRTPPTRRYGNMVWVQGASGGSTNRSNDGSRDRRGWWKIGSTRGHHRPDRGSAGWTRRGSSSVSQESLRGAVANEIQLDTVTTVVVEIDSRNKEPAGSVDSTEKGIAPSLRSEL
ncbi:uncharacterized protein JN550_012629 [Neoarthrinium moseri]|uniref:uncharacterized protein n=1 Tax=Neoarthrinium moseri TaxID=1658444 RepID=UPI001FDBF875|nr:uncharacterized protein JN550_012629 [Neoarthrinium moseri]KAI1858496.1 hypothetical protein JN550_012629 [Neoarthrinium moseri]